MDVLTHVPLSFVITGAVTVTESRSREPSVSSVGRAETEVVGGIQATELWFETRFKAGTVVCAVGTAGQRH